MGWIAYVYNWQGRSYDPPECHPGKQVYTFLIRILSTSFIPVSIFSVCCYSRVSISMELESPLYSKYGGLVCTWWTKRGVGGKCANEQMWRVDWAAAEHLQSPFSSPFFSVKWPYDYGFWVWMEAGRWVEFHPKIFPCNCTLQSSNSDRSDLRFEAWKRICYKKIYGSLYWSLERLWKPVLTLIRRL